MADEQHSVKIAMAQISPATLWDFFSAIKFGNGKKLNNRLIVIRMSRFVSVHLFLQALSVKTLILILSTILIYWRNCSASCVTIF